MAARLRCPSRYSVPQADDGVLLQRFRETRDEAAFAAIVKRHGGLVLGVCRRILRDGTLAEDAFQAVFLVLARRPEAAAKSISLAGWLFGTARRVSFAARRSEMRRRRREQMASVHPSAVSKPEWDDLLLVVDEELAKLPEEYRVALIACYLRDRTQDEAARELGWSLSTLRRRLERGRDLLKARLTRRGATFCGGLFASLLAPSNAVAVPSELLFSAGRESEASPIAMKLASGGAVVKWPALAVLLVFGLAVAVAAWPRHEAVHADPGPITARPQAARAIAGRIVFPLDRELPERREILRTDGFVKDAECCFRDGRRLYFENAILEPNTRGVANAVVWLRPDSGDPKAKMPATDPTASVERIVNVVECQFVPRITAGRVGDSIRFVNAAPIATNVKYDAMPRGPGIGFGSFNVLLAAHGGFANAPGGLVHGSASDRFESTIYPWMKGRVWAFDHPYFAVADAEGRFAISNVPPGPWWLVVWHEEFGTFTRRLSESDAELGSVPFVLRSP